MKEFFKDYWTIMIIVIAIICAVSFIVYLIASFGVGFTGPLGDTFGGLFSPLIGIMTLVLVYKTFNDQRSSNDLNKSATNLDILFKILDRYKAALTIINIPPANINPLNINNLPFIPHVFSIFQFSTIIDREHIRWLLQQTRELVQITDNVNLLNLQREHRDLFVRELRITALPIFELNHPSLLHILDVLQHLPIQNDGSLNAFIAAHNEFTTNVNYYATSMAEYIAVIRRLNNAGVIRVAPIPEEVINLPQAVIVPANLFAQPNINYDLVNSLRNINAFGIE